MTRRFDVIRRHGGLLIGGLILLIVLAIALFADWVAPAGPWNMASAPLQPPSLNDLLGTDNLGRDIAAGVAHGARTSMLISLVSSVASLVIGITVGAPAGYFGGVADRFLMQVSELFQTIPGFIFAITLVAIFEPSIWAIVIAIVAVSWAPVARIVRAEVLSLRTREYVQASRLAGHADFSILCRDIIPNTLPVVVTYTAILMANAILLESSMSFLGLSDPNLMSWGYMVGASRSIVRLAWWAAVFPGLAIFLTILAINLIAAGLRQHLDPKRTRSLS
ncbi:ABC transporter permease [Bradyrhizobium prioriisuperbiae]|uniref:ABC transporter permease n=1 Tax=Bradyrhizobium prioriisuperbiae TaxID=2854389 RepID=UPI0028E651D9|nr:ABC transporter permease [Bradyrhizobium prioritasuperba]